MSGSETGLIASREAYGVGVEKNPISSQPPMIQNVRLGFSADGTAVYKPISPTSPSYNHTVIAGGGGGGGGGGTAQGTVVDMNMSGEPMKRRRGRPRKYAPDGPNSLALTHAVATQSEGPFSSSPVGGGAASRPSYSVKKSRGRPPGSRSKKHQLEALGSAGLGFTPHVITVKAGEDVSAKIMSFSQQGPRAVCILSANGAISNVTLRQPATSGGTVTYEGRYEILSLSGSFMLQENGGQRSRTGGLSVSLAGPDGRVVGGCVAGLLTAAAPVQVVVGSFIANGQKESKATNQVEPSSVTPKLPPSTNIGAVEACSPPSRGTLSESSSEGGSPLNQSTGAYNNSDPKGMPAMPWK